MFGEGTGSVLRDAHLVMLDPTCQPGMEAKAFRLLNNPKASLLISLKTITYEIDNW
jgi:hypothetical protein